MSWRLARGLEKLRDQVNAIWPARSKESDGSIGDTSHSARLSDHNPDDAGVVHAIDLTHDPKGGFDSYAFADMMLKKQDHRLKYVISNRRIGSGPAGPAPGVWRPYTGINPHNHHCHISIMYGALADDVAPWAIDGTTVPDPATAAAYVAPPPTLRMGDRGVDVETMQTMLPGVAVDGDFGPVTAAALKAFQARSGLVSDGICGPMTWKALLS
jgi:peptidoglycan hydrolase-like protein with peptidoglycan-binding domain